VLSNLWHHRLLSVDSHAVRRSIDGMVRKFEVHGHLDIARNFRELVTVFLNSKVFHNHPQVSCCRVRCLTFSALILHLLFCMSILT
jgi:hypothetical protein